MTDSADKAGKTEQEAIEATVRDLSVSEAEARFIVAIERGEIDGDEVVIEPADEQAAKN